MKVLMLVKISDAAKKMIELSGQRGVPVITVDDEVIVGFDSQRLNELFGQYLFWRTL